MGMCAMARQREYALFLKSRLLGENPCNVERLFKIISQFGHHGRQGGGVSGVEMALWDLVGKAYGVPVYQLLGGKYRDRVRLYCDTTISRDPQEYARRMQERIDKGYTALKMDIGINLLRDTPGAIVNGPNGNHDPYQYEYRKYNLTKHPFTRVQVTEKGLEKLCEFLEVMRNQIGYEIPMGTDHWGHFGVNEAIKIARAVEKYNPGLHRRYHPLAIYRPMARDHYFYHYAYSDRRRHLHALRWLQGVDR